jgi:Mg-chelatase subunit ChlD
MTFLQPIWLMLVFPLALGLWVWPLSTRWLMGLRIAALALIVLAMSGPAVRLPSRAGTVVVVADRSFSMPGLAADRQTELIHALRSNMGVRDQLGVLAFAQRVAVELPPGHDQFNGFSHLVNRGGSNLDKALGAAMALIPDDAPGRIFVISDGRWTGPDPAATAARAAAANIAIDYQLLQRPTANDLAIARVGPPASVAPGEAFMINSFIQSPVPQRISYQLLRNDTVIASGARQVPAGISRLTFRDRAEEPGTNQYLLNIRSDADDPVPENNTARMLVGIEGPLPIAHVTESPASQLGELLRAGRLNVVTLNPAQMDWSLEGLSNYSAVLLENCPAPQLGDAAMEQLAGWVNETGAGLMMTGGRQSFGPGGYFKSPLDPILPVSMELRQEHRKFALALVVALDRSGSMSMTVGGGRTKMDLANLATAEALDLLGPMDEFGAVAVDSSPHQVAKLTQLNDPARRRRIRNDVLSIESMGGGIFVYEALSHAAAMIADSNASTRHIILFSDAQDSEEPGKYKQLLEQCKDAGITVTVIGLGKPTDVDAGLLRDIAQRGEGRIFFTENAEELPRLFAQDTFIVARSSFLEQITPVRATAGMNLLADQSPSISQPVGGYNLTYLKPKANLAAVTEDDNSAPLVASWSSGIGRVVCYTGEADGKYTGPIAQWPGVGRMFSSLGRWAVGKGRQLSADTLVTQETESGQSIVRVHLDPDRQRQPFDQMPKVRVLRGVLGRPPQASELPMEWADADTLEAHVALEGNETAIATVDAGSAGSVSLPPVCLPYSPEFRPIDEQVGPATLQRLARITSGTQRIAAGDIWDDLPHRPRLIDIGPWLLFVAVLLFLLEVLERRSGWLSTRGQAIRRIRLQRQPAEDKPAKPLHQRARRTASQPTPSPQKPDSQPKPTSKQSDKPSEPQTDTDMFDAMRRAQQRARGRTNRS